jgi:hypothetical protein
MFPGFCREAAEVEIDVPAFGEEDKTVKRSHLTVPYWATIWQASK